MIKTKMFGAAMAAATLAGGLAMASGASATEANPTTSLIKLQSASMSTNWTANVGTNAGNQIDAYANGVTFNYVNLDPTSKVQVGGVYTIYGFCVDITHDMYINTTLNYNYTDNYTPVTGPVGNPLPTDFHGGVITPTQLSDLTALIDTGWLLHEQQLTLNSASAAYANLDLQLAAIQAAIWKVEGGYVTLNNAGGTAHANTGGAIAGSATMTYQDYFNAYSSGNFTNLGDANDSFYTIVQATPNYDEHQSFAIGWPIAGVPEPAAWSLMMVGFGGLGAVLRARRQRAALA